MATLHYLTGFEYGVINSTLFPGLGVQGTATVTADAAAARTGGYGLRITTTDAAGSRGGPGKLSSAAGGFITLRFAMNVRAMPGVNSVTVAEMGASSNYNALFLDSSGTLSYRARSGGSIETGPTLSLNTWYVIEFSFDSRANPWVTKLTVDGTAYTDATVAQAANTGINPEWYIEVWQNAGLTPGGCSVDFDDVAVSVTPADVVAIGDGAVLGLLPTGVGTHSTATSFETTTNSFTGNTGLESDANAHQKIDDIPWNPSATDYLRQSVANAGHYAEFALGDTGLSGTTPVNAVHMKSYCRTASAAAAALTGKIALSGTETTMHTTSALNSTSRVLQEGIATAKPGGGSWTAADVDSTIIRLGYSGDVTPNPWVDATILEVDYQISGAIEQAIGQASETDSAQTVSRAKAKATGQPSETGTAQALTRSKRRAVGQASATDSAQALTARKTLTLGIATTSETAGAVTPLGPIVEEIGQASDTSTAQPLTARKAKAIGQASTTDAAQALTARKTRELGQAATTDSAQALGRAKAAAIGQASTTDTAQTVTRTAAIVQSIGQVSDTSTAQPFAYLKRKAIGQASETASAQALAKTKLRTLGQAVETDASRPVAWALRGLVGQVTETSYAFEIAALGGGTPPPTPGSVRIVTVGLGRRRTGSVGRTLVLTGSGRR